MKSKKVTLGLLAFYLLALAWIILLKFQFSFVALDRIRNINLIPFCESVIANGRIDFHEIILNVVAFVPFGVFAYALWQEKSFLSQILPVFLTSLGFEVIQFIFAIGATDITDLITNTSGGVIGIGIAFVLSKIFKNNWRKCINISGFACAVLLSLFILVLLLANL